MPLQHFVPLGLLPFSLILPIISFYFPYFPQSKASPAAIELEYSKVNPLLHLGTDSLVLFLDSVAINPSLGKELECYAESTTECQ